MKKIQLLIFVLMLAISIHPQQLSKVYVLSEGGFSANTSKLSVLDVQSNNFTQSIFSPGNIGLYSDGLIYHEGFLYLTEQGNYSSSGKIYKLDTLGTVISSATVGTNPYSLAIANNKIFITNGPASNVSVLNLSDLSFIKDITVGIYPQEIIAYNNKVFVANTSLYGGASDSTVSVIDPVSDAVVATITLKKDPSAFAISNDGYLFVGCPGDESTGKIFKIDASTYQQVDSYDISTYGFGKSISVDKNSDNIFFISYLNDIVKYDLTTRTASIILTSVYPNNFYYGYGYDYLTKQHFVLDAKNFTSNGSLRILDNAYNVINEYQTSIAPIRVVFKYNNMPSAVSEDNVLNSFKLEQNYPNPFNPVTNIQFAIADRQFVTLKVFDVLGNEIATLVNEEKEPGMYIVNFTGNNMPAGRHGLATGIYYYTIKAGNFTQTRKMVLMK